MNYLFISFKNTFKDLIFGGKMYILKEIDMQIYVVNLRKLIF